MPIFPVCMLGKYQIRLCIYLLSCMFDQKSIYWGRNVTYRQTDTNVYWFPAFPCQKYLFSRQIWWLFMTCVVFTDGSLTSRQSSTGTDVRCSRMTGEAPQLRLLQQQGMHFEILFSLFIGTQTGKQKHLTSFPAFPGWKCLFSRHIWVEMLQTDTNI